MLRVSLLSLLTLALVSCTPSAHTPSPEPPSAPASKASVLAQIQSDARSLASLVHSPFARAFLAATADLPPIGPRRVYIDADKSKAYTEAEITSLDETERKALSAKELDDEYYYTNYSTPLAYARPIDLLNMGESDLVGQRVFDFGYGNVGHLRLLASLGAQVTGVEVNPVLRALYSQPGDQGKVRSRLGKDGSLQLLSGLFPQDDALREAAGSGYALFLSKNVLKRGYIHPSEPVDEKKRIRLGVDDEVFVKTIYDMLNPGGRALIYNITPAPNAPGKPYIPWADGRCPFARELIERVGFRVLAFDENDTEAVRAMGRTLGWDKGEEKMDIENDLFAMITMLEKPLTTNAASGAAPPPASR